MIREPRKNPDSYVKYSGLAIQMMVIIVAGVFGGWKADEALHTKPLFTILLSLFSVIISIYLAVKDLLRK